MDHSPDREDGKREFLPFEPITLRNDAPVEQASENADLLNFTPLAKEVAAIAVGTEGPFTMAITAKWGYGKTSMLGLVRDLIRQYGEAVGDNWSATHTSVWFNAWQYEREEEPVIPLVLAVQEAVAESIGHHQSAWDKSAPKVWEALKKLPPALLDVAAGFKFKSKVGTALWLQLLTGLEAKVDVEAEPGKIIEGWRKTFEATESPALPETAFVQAMRNLTVISKGLQEATQGNAPERRPKIIVFVDDLDRCHPDAALRLLDGIKLVLNQPGFVFVLALDKTILEEFLVRRYREEYGAQNPREVGRRYVDKIIQLEIPLPPQLGRFAGSNELQRLIPDFQGKGYLERVAFDMLRSSYAFQVADVFRQCDFLSPRDVVRHLLRLRLDLRLYEAVGEPIKGRTEEEIAIAATIMRLVEGAFDASSRGDFLDLVTNERLGERLWEAVTNGFALEDDDTRRFKEPMDDRTPLPQTVFLTVRRQPGLVAALAAYGELWLRDVLLRRRLLEFFQPGAIQSLTDPEQRELVETAIRQALSLKDNDLLPSSLSNVRELSMPSLLRDDGVEMLAGLTSLRELSLRETLVSRIPSLRKLKVLSKLSLGKTNVSDISPLEDLIELTELDISDTQVSDITPLAKLSNLRTLNLSGTSVFDISPLINLSLLKDLSLWNTEITDMSSLDFSVFVETLRFSSTKEVDLSPISSLLGLKFLILGGEKIAGLPSLANLEKLTRLELIETTFLDLSPLAEVKGLTDLIVWRTAISELTPLKALTDLTRLELVGSAISDLTPIRALEQLRRLDLEGRAIVDLEPLVGLRRLRTLILSKTGVADLSPLNKLVGLEVLSISDTPISDISPLRGISGLTHLSLWNTQVKDLTPLEELGNLKQLELLDMAITDLQPIAKLSGLERLQLYGTKVSDEQKTRLRQLRPDILVED